MPSPLIPGNLRSVLCPTTTLEAWTFTEQELEEAISGKRLLNPSLDLSNACNLNCPYCFVEPVDSLRKKRKSTELSLDEIKQVVAIFAELGARTVNLIGAGDPPVDPNFSEIIKQISNLGMRVLVATNGIELVRKPTLINLLKEVGASVVLKLNSFKPDVEDGMVGKQGYSVIRDQALANLLEAGFARNKPTRLAANAVITKGNQAEIPSIHQYCRERNICYIAGPYMPTGRTEGSEFHGHAVVTSADEDVLEGASVDTLNKLRVELSRWDAEHDFPVIENAAYTSGLPCTQALGIYLDIYGKVWHCPAKQQVTPMYMTPLALMDLKSGNSLSAHNILQDNYLSVFRDVYDGQCPYKHNHTINLQIITETMQS